MKPGCRLIFDNIEALVAVDTLFVVDTRVVVDTLVRLVLLYVVDMLIVYKHGKQSRPRRKAT